MTSDIANPQDDTKGDCFIVMPFGRTDEEIEWFAGWYEVAIEPAVVQAGYDPVLAASEEKPNAINDEIRQHLALDPMVVVDLGGMHPDDAPNPNVMYELGIRHAMNLPLVMLAWAKQKLPFDIANQRVISLNRNFKNIAATSSKIKTGLQDIVWVDSAG